MILASSLISGLFAWSLTLSPLDVEGDLYGSWLQGNLDYIDFGVKAKASWEFEPSHHLRQNLKSYYWDDFKKAYASIETATRHEWMFSNPVYGLTQVDFRRNEFKGLSREFDFLGGLGITPLDGLYLEYRVGHRWTKRIRSLSEHFLIQILYAGYFYHLSERWKLSAEALVDHYLHQWDGNPRPENIFEKSRAWSALRMDYFFTSYASLYITAENYHFFEKFPGVSRNDLSVRYGLHISI